MDRPPQDNRRRTFLLRSAAGAASAAALAVPQGAQAQVAATASAAPAPVGYRWLLPSEQGFVEALVNHMCPADSHSPNGMDMGLHIYFDQALAGEWGQGARLYLKGPFIKGTANQGYQLGLTPAQLFRAGTEGLVLYCAKQYGKAFESLSPADKDAVLQGLQANRITLPNEVPANTYFAHLYQLFVEGMFSDPVYGGNRNKMGWKMIGYPGVSTNNRQNIVRFKNRPYQVEPTSIADMS
ncbi:gluconate 2-dehydrogenase subunit 3 family protein [Hydrogenophaga sp. OTU3427]|uniref:gluconate 2-dehydrogenase subunit 3 family protein n=1 Tax=Hydrogenophaga sp. OTU3427 TaxID=3043856 RepID=UPI00313C1529